MLLRQDSLAGNDRSNGVHLRRSCRIKASWSPTLKANAICTRTKMKPAYAVAIVAEQLSRLPMALQIGSNTATV
jgi:hypothetical protein